MRTFTPHRFYGVYNIYQVMDKFLQSLRTDTVGSFELPEGTTLAELVERQACAGLKAVTDGHITRKHWDLDFFNGFGGLELSVISGGRVYQEYASMTGLLRMTGRVSYSGSHPVFREFANLYAAAHRHAEAKQTMPAPSQLLHTLLSDNEWRKFYDSEGAVARDIAEAYRLTIVHLYELGCRFVQFDDCSAAPFCDERGIKEMLLGGVDPMARLRRLAAVNNTVAGAVPSGMRTALYMCRGCYDSPERTGGNYSFVAPHVFPRLAFDALYLDLNVDSSNDYSVLSYLPDGKKVMLGVMPAFDHITDSAAHIVDNVHEASDYYPIANLGLTFRSGLRPDRPIAQPDSAQWQRIALMQKAAGEIAEWR